MTTFADKFIPEYPPGEKEEKKMDKLNKETCIRVVTASHATLSETINRHNAQVRERLASLREKQAELEKVLQEIREENDLLCGLVLL
ncbi:hypothetical protein LCGC14_2209340 [marine sediment metagenome]|uniref:Uncharacterized protein n=1 Tax=marine sediment metagenome TaxID=412755 RepID=A0A0F9FRN4_9ZZZZ